MQAGAEKLGVIEASYASAIIGVLSPVSSHCEKMDARGKFASDECSVFRENQRRTTDDG